MTRTRTFAKIHLVLAGIAHLVERHLAKVEVASSSLVARSKKGNPHPTGWGFPFCAETFGNSLHPPAVRGAHYSIRGQGRVPADGQRPSAGCREASSSLVARSKKGNPHPTGWGFPFCAETFGNSLHPPAARGARHSIRGQGRVPADGQRPSAGYRVASSSLVARSKKGAPHPTGWGVPFCTSAGIRVYCQLPTQDFFKVYGLSIYNSGKNWYNDVRYFVERRGIL